MKFPQAYLQALQHARALGALAHVRRIEVYDFCAERSAMAHCVPAFQKSHLREVAQRCGLWVLMVQQKGALIRVKVELDLKRARFYWMTATVNRRHIPDHPSGRDCVMEYIVETGVPSVRGDLVFAYELRHGGQGKSAWQAKTAADFETKRAFVHPPLPSVQEILKGMF